MTVAEVADVVAGSVIGTRDIRVTGPAFVDSRRAEPGGLFVAVPGERVDGHDYAAAAVDAGASAVLSQRPLGLPGVVVADCVSAIGALASHVVSRLTGATVVGITGSQGKTGCKDILAQLLEMRGATVASAGSFNNEIGVPLTVLRADDATRYLVVEMGARGRGHIRALAEMVRPKLGIVLNVGVAHLGEFGSRLDIARAKGELVEALPSDGVAVLNADDERVAGMRSRTPALVTSFGRDRDADMRLADVQLDDVGHVRFRLAYVGAERVVTVPLVGEHHAVNAAAAAAAAVSCGMTFDAVCDTLSSVSARSPWRMQMATSGRGVTVINDAYNANPDSMRAALQTLAALGSRSRAGRRTFAVLGEMRELGQAADREHEQVGRLAAQLGVTDLVVVGEAARSIQVGAARETSWDGEAVILADPAAAAGYLRDEAREGDLVLVKASRAAGLETVALALLEEPVEVR